MKRTIEDLTVSKTFYHRERDAFGNRTVDPYQKQIKREIQLVTGWRRFGHYVIDGLIIAGIVFLIELALAISNVPSFTLSRNHIGFMYNFIPSLANIVITVSYYFICEKTMQRTIGKFATNTVVINQYAEAPDASSLARRSFARLVPFEAFSCLGDRGWHDRWSKTYVVLTSERDALRRLLNEQDGVFISDSKDLLD